MAITPTDRAVVDSYFRAMQAGPNGEREMVSLFSDDAEYIEPFSAQGKPTSHKGIHAIREFFHQSFQGPMGSGVKLSLDRLDLDGDRLRSEWTCEVPTMPGPFKGTDHYTIRDGKIQRLEINLSAPHPG
ncbi:MAG: nuclear transport factor 2 family protein [Chloroflexota bacterium]|nr:nuclear transport factor 2 family protein [Chloroflexota bacterium]